MRKGFTLLELLIVVVILGILALIAAPTLLSATDRAKDAAVQANVSAAASSMTSRFALDSDDDADINASIAAVVLALNDGVGAAANNKSPYDKTKAAFGDTGKGQVNLVASGTDKVIITGYGKGATAIITKTVAAPADN